MGKGDSIVSKIGSTFFINIYFDLFWLLPYTIMNLYVFVKLINHLIQGQGSTYQHVSFVLLKVYLFWSLVSLCIIGYAFYRSGTFDNSLSPYSPTGSLTILYLLLGNFIFLLVFVPLWNKFIQKWVV
jgi:hypothetical protein